MNPLGNDKKKKSDIFDKSLNKDNNNNLLDNGDDDSDIGGDNYDFDMDSDQQDQFDMSDKKDNKDHKTSNDTDSKL